MYGFMQSKQFAREQLGELSTVSGLEIAQGKIRRSSSRFCLGVEHGDYNGTELFGVGTDRFIIAHRGHEVRAYFRSKK